MSVTLTALDYKPGIIKNGVKKTSRVYGIYKMEKIKLNKIYYMYKYYI